MSLVPRPRGTAANAGDLLLSVVERSTSLGDYLGAKAGQGWWNSSPGQALAELRLPRDYEGSTGEAVQGYAAALTLRLNPALAGANIIRGAITGGFSGAMEAGADVVGAAPEARLLREAWQGITGQNESQPVLAETDWKASAFYRDGLRWDPRMTAARAEALAEIYDENRWREGLIERRQNGVFGAVAGFVAQLAGGLPDPINYVPIAGPAVRAAAIARLAPRFGRIGATAAITGTEAAIGTAFVTPAIYAGARQFGDDLGFADMALDVAFGALTGAAIGGSIAGGAALRDRVRLVRATRGLVLKDNALGRLNESVDALIRDQPVDVAPISERERQQLGMAYDQVRSSPQGPATDPFVSLRPEDIEAVAVARGGWNGIGDVTVQGQGWGLAKIIWRHGEGSGKSPRARITREDVLAFPEVVRSFGEMNEGGRRVWRVQRVGENGLARPVTYVARRTENAPQDYLITIYAEERGLKPLSPARPDAGAPGSSSPLRRRLGDTTGEPSDRLPQGQAAPAPENVAPAVTEFNARTAAAAPLAEAPTPLVGKTDTTIAAVTPPTRLQGWKATQDAAAEHGLDQTGGFVEMADYDALARSGQLTPEEVTEFEAANALLARSERYGDLYQAAAGCILGNG